MYKAREQEDILTELQGYSNLETSKVEGTFEYDVLASNSLEFAKGEVELEEAYKAAFADTAHGEYLTMRTAESGVIRKPAVKATGKVTVTGSGLVTEGSLFATAAGVQFAATKDVEVITSGEVPIQAVLAGDTGNVAAGTITIIPMSIAGITGVTNEEPTADGYDEESDDALLDRYLLHVRNPGTSGNPRHYEEWATSVAGVGAAKCIRSWNGPNTVKVVIVDSNYESASTELIQTVYDYIETVRPVGAIVTVVSATSKVIDIAADIVGVADVEAFRAEVLTYFSETERTSLASGGGQVSVARIGAILLNYGGVTDYSNLTINGSAVNIAIASEEIPVLGAVTLNA